MGNYFNHHMGQNEFSYELTTVTNKKVNETLRVEINQFCDGLRNTMRSSYAIDKI